MTEAELSDLDEVVILVCTVNLAAAEPLGVRDLRTCVNMLPLRGAVDIVHFGTYYETLCSCIPLAPCV